MISTAENPAQRVVQADGGVMCGAKFQCVCAFGDPCGMLKYAAVSVNEGVDFHPARALIALIWVLFGPMLRDVDAARGPDLFKALNVLDEALSPASLPGRPISRLCKPMLIILGAPALPSA